MVYVHRWACRVHAVVSRLCTTLGLIRFQALAASSFHCKPAGNLNIGSHNGQKATDRDPDFKSRSSAFVPKKKNNHSILSCMSKDIVIASLFPRLCAAGFLALGMR